MTFLYPIWLFFSAFFFYFAYLNWRQTSEQIRPFSIRERDDQPTLDPELAGANTQFVTEFNNYLDGTNSHNKSRHRAAAFGYFVAGMVSLISMFLILFAEASI